MGDVAISVPILRAFRSQYPKVKITVLTRPLFAPIFDDITDCEVFVVDFRKKHKGFWGLYRLFKELQKRDIDAVADLHNVLRTNILKILFRLSAVPFFQIDKGRSEKKALTRKRNKIFKPLKTSAERYADIFSHLGFPLNLEKKYLSPPPVLSANVENLLATDTSIKMIGIAPFAAHAGKMYDWQKMQRVAQKLASMQYEVYLFGGTKEKAVLEAFSNENQHITNVAGILSFSEELALISRMNLMLAMDSGNAHLAALYGIPVVTLWGVTHPYAGFYPYAQPENYALVADNVKFPLIPTSVYGNKYPKGYEQAINTISEEDIIKKVVSILE